MILKDPLDRMAARLAASTLYALEQDEDTFGLLWHIVGLNHTDLALVRNRLLIIANRLESQSGLPKRMVEWKERLQCESQT